jgi:hypothetical protein
MAERERKFYNKNGKINITIICCIPIDNNSIVSLTVFLKKEKVFFHKCEQNNFCEQLPLIMKEIMFFFEKKYGYKIRFDEVEYKIDFDINKHITTYRIFESFINGFTIN